MAQKVVGLIKLQIPAGNANPAPPVGPALGQHGVNIMDFFVLSLNSFMTCVILCKHYVIHKGIQ